MKKNIIFILALLTLMGGKVMSQTGGKKAPLATDATTGYLYDIEKAQEVIFERIVNPAETNADAQVILNAKDFPRPLDNKVITEGYKVKVREWIEKNPTLIINTFKKRKDVVQQY